MIRREKFNGDLGRKQVRMLFPTKYVEPWIHAIDTCEYTGTSGQNSLNLFYQKMLQIIYAFCFML